MLQKQRPIHQINTAHDPTIAEKRTTKTHVPNPLRQNLLCFCYFFVDWPRKPCTQPSRPVLVFFEGLQYVSSIFSIPTAEKNNLLNPYVIWWLGHWKKHWDVNREAHLCSTTWTHSPVVKATQMLSNDLGFCDIKCTEMWKYKQLEETCKSTPCGDAAWGFRLAKKHPLRFRTRNLQITHKWMMCFHHWL